MTKEELLNDLHSEWWRLTYHIQQVQRDMVAIEKHIHRLEDMELPGGKDDVK